MSSPLVQTLIGGGRAIVGGLFAAWWQTARADNMAQRIRRAERYESALVELNARTAEALSQVIKVWQDGRELVLHGRGHEGIDASYYDLAAQPLDDLLDHWHSSASLIMSDSAIVDGFSNPRIEKTMHLSHDHNVAYSQPAPVGGKARLGAVHWRPRNGLHGYEQRIQASQQSTRRYQQFR
jgi:hypothetical protein